MNWPLSALLALLAFLLFFFLGYWLGKRHGRKLGFNEAAAIIPLANREKYLEEGSCPLCERKAEENKNMEQGIFSL